MHLIDWPARIRDYLPKLNSTPVFKVHDNQLSPSSFYLFPFTFYPKPTPYALLLNIREIAFLASGF